MTSASIQSPESFVYDHVAELCRDKDHLIDWLIKQGILGDFSGTHCSKGMLTRKRDSSYGKDGWVWRCTFKACGKKVSIRHNSWFSGSHLTLTQMMKHLYYWTVKTPNDVITRELRLGSDHTVVELNNFAREVCITVMENLDTTVIGGPGKTVEIYEAKFGKRKYHRGKSVEGVWLLGAIERESSEVFLLSVPDRSAETLLPGILSHVAKGTTIITDSWEGYCQLGKLGYIHRTVNNSVEYKNTDTIEPTCRAVKRPRTGTQKRVCDFFEYMFRKKFFKKGTCRFRTFLDAVKKMYNPTHDPLAPTVDN